LHISHLFGIGGIFVKWCLVRLAVLSFLLLVASCLLLTAGAVKSSAADPVPYGQAFQRDYVSSVDGTFLPCSIYVPPSSAGQPMPVWVDLHALDGPGGVRPDWQSWAATRGMMVLSPWGRNFRGLWMDGIEPSGTPKEPCIFDDFATLSSSWQKLSSNWTLNQIDGCYQQNEIASGWSQAVHTASSGANYSVSVDLKETGGSASLSAMGITFRRQANGDCYWVDMANSSGTKLLRLYRYKGGAWSPLAIDDLGASFDLRARHNLKVMVFADTIQVRIDGLLHELDKTYTYHQDTTELPERQDSSFSSGLVGLCGLGGTHQFDNFRVQNEFLYGERDVMDSLDQFLEEFSRDPNYRVDLNRIYLSGFSVGGTGAWNISLH
jgi:hypothetical protein